LSGMPAPTNPTRCARVIGGTRARRPKKFGDPARRTRAVARTPPRWLSALPLGAAGSVLLNSTRQSAADRPPPLGGAGWAATLERLMCPHASEQRYVASPTQESVAPPPTLEARARGEDAD